MRVIALILSLLVATQSYALSKGKAFVVGGSCEDSALQSFGGMPASRNFNLAFTTMRDMGNGLKKRGWDVDVQYESLTSDCSDTCGKVGKCSAQMDSNYWTRACLAQSMKLKRNEIKKNTFENFLHGLKEETKRVKSGQGKQVLVTFITHGLPKGDPGVITKGHTICFSKPDGSFEFVPTDHPKIKEALQGLKNAGASIGILDGSCYGGQTVDTLKDYGCVLSSQTEEQPAAFGTGITESLINMMNKHKTPFSLEQVFEDSLWDRLDEIDLGAVRQKNDFTNTNLPRISTLTSNDERNFLNILSADVFNISLMGSNKSGMCRADQLAEIIDRKFSSKIGEIMANRAASAAKGRSLPMMDQLAEELKSELYDYQNKYELAAQMLQSSEDAWQELINTSENITIPEKVLKKLRDKLKGVDPLLAPKMENALLELVLGEIGIEQGQRDFKLSHEGIAFLEDKQFHSSMMDYYKNDLNLSHSDEKRFKGYLKAGLPTISQSLKKAIGIKKIASIKDKMTVASDKGNKAYSIQKKLNNALPSIYDKVSSLRLMNFYSNLMENKGSNPCSDFSI